MRLSKSVATLGLGFAVALPAALLPEAPARSQDVVDVSVRVAPPPLSVYEPPLPGRESSSRAK